MNSGDVSQERRGELRSLNSRIINLTAHVVSKITLLDGRLTIQFDPVADTGSAFCVQLGGVVGFVDRGLLFAPLTTGLVWDMAGQFGRENALQVGRTRTKGLVELRLDHQGKRVMRCRFQAVAHTAIAWDGPLSGELE